MNDQKTWCLVLGIISGGICYGTLPYGEMELFGSSILFILGALTFLSSVFVGFFKEGKPVVKNSFYLTTGVLAGCFLRILYDVIFVDSTHHNLWPIELLIIAAVTFPMALVGFLVTSYIKKIVVAK